jgi:hypothetical protein
MGGPDEDTPQVNNSGYFNVGSMIVLRSAVALGKQLGPSMGAVKNFFGAIFDTETVDQFTKTGSGQTQEKLSKNGVSACRRPRRREESAQVGEDAGKVLFGQVETIFAPVLT